MKSVKKIFSLILTGLMLSNYCVAMASGDEQIVSLKFSESDVAVTDEYDNAVAVYGTVTPEKINTMTGEQVILKSEGVIEIDGEELINSDEMTFETWINISSKETKSTERRIFALRRLENASDGDKAVAEVVYRYNSGTAVLKNRLGTIASPEDEEHEWIEHSTEDIYGYADTWRHYTFTRKWDEDSSEWMTKTYVNGVLVNSSEESGVKLIEDGCKLYVGFDKTKITGLSKGLNCIYGTFNVYKKELSGERIKELYESTKNDFRVASNDMNIESITPEEGDISCDGETFTLKFSNFIDASTVKGNVVFSKADGGAVEGWKATVRDDIFIDITAPKLNHREKYKITVKSGLKSQNDISATEKEFIYTAKKAGLIIDEDFQDERFVVGESAPSMPGIQFTSNHINGKSTYIKVGKTESGTKYLRLSPVELNKSEAISITFEDFSEGCPVIEYKVRVGGDDSIEPRMGMLNKVNGTYLATVTNPIKLGGKVVDTDAEGFAYFKVIIRKNESGYYYYEVHYTSGGEEKIYDVRFDSKMITSISAYNIIQYYQTKGAVSPDNYLDLSYICHYILNEPKVTESNLATFNTETDDTVTVTFNEKIKEDTISKDTVKLINKATGYIVPWTFVSYDAETKTAAFEVEESYLEYATEYDVDCFGTETEDGIKNAVSTKTTFETPALDITLSNPSFSKSEEGISFRTSVYSETAADVKFIGVLYDMNLRAVQVKEATTTEGSASLLMDYPSIGAGYMLKVIAAQNDDGNLKPITKMPLEYQVK